MRNPLSVFAEPQYCPSHFQIHYIVYTGQLGGPIWAPRFSDQVGKISVKIGIPFVEMEYQNGPAGPPWETTQERT